MKQDKSSTPSCSNCSQPIRNPEFPKCMYCGHTIPESDRLSPEEAQMILRNKALEKQNQREAEKRKSEGDWGYRKYRESGGYEDDDGGLDFHWNIGGDE